MAKRLIFAILLVAVLLMSVLTGCSQSESVTDTQNTKSDALYAQCDGIADEDSQTNAITIQKPLCLLSLAHNSSIPADDAFQELQKRSPRFYAALEQNNKVEVLKQQYLSTSDTKAAMAAILANLS